MAWGLIVVGSILILHGLFKKFKKHKTAKNKETDSNLLLKREIKRIKRELNKMKGSMKGSITEDSADRPAKKVNINDYRNNYHLETRVNGYGMEKKFRSVFTRETGKFAGERKKYEKVQEYARRGMKPEDIARKLAIGVRETKLILKLSGRKADKNVR